LVSIHCKAKKMVGHILLVSTMSRHRRRHAQRENDQRVDNRRFTRNPNYRAPFADASSNRALQLEAESKRQKKKTVRNRRRKKNRHPSKARLKRKPFLSFFRRRTSPVAPAGDAAPQPPPIAVARPHIAQTVAVPALVLDDMSSNRNVILDATATPVIAASLPAAHPERHWPTRLNWLGFLGIRVQAA
jgi:hypothetical protein